MNISLSRVVFTGLNIIFLINFLLILTTLTFETVAVNKECEYFQYLAVGTKYYIYNREYPNSYPSGTDCLWLGQSPPGTNIVLTCDVNLPSSRNCNGDKLKISLSGDDNFGDSKNYCGMGSISLVTDSNFLAVALVAKGRKSSGKFICTLTAIQNPEVPFTTPSPFANTCDCGWKRGTRIVGGVPTLVNEYPAMAGILDASIREIICGSTIISSRYVLTAAHCMRNVKLENMGILVGDWNISTGLDTSATALYRAETYWEHPDFDTTRQTNDLAIVRTMKQITFSLYVGPICLPFLYTYDTFEKDNVTILGWGQEFFNGPQSDVLEKAEVQIVSNADCQQKYPGNVITPNQICTYAPNKDACQRDSGGPILWQDPNSLRLQLIGVISYGLGCATTKPGVGSRVTNYLPWIVKVTTDTNFCIR